MITRIGEKLTYLFLKYMPNAFVFAIVLTLLTASIAFVWSDASPLKIITSWYDGFFDLLQSIRSLHHELVSATWYCH